MNNGDRVIVISYPKHGMVGLVGTVVKGCPEKGHYVRVELDREPVGIHSKTNDRVFLFQPAELAVW